MCATSSSQKARGTTVFFSSHIIPDVETICDRVAILVEGKLRAVGEVRDLLAQEADAYELTFVGALTGPPRTPRWPPASGSDAWWVRVSSESATGLIRELADAGRPLVSLSPVRSTPGGVPPPPLRAAGGRHEGGRGHRAQHLPRGAARPRALPVSSGSPWSLLVGTKLLGLLTVGDEGKVIKDLGLAGIQFFSMLIAVMMSVLLISREVDSRMVFNILAKPVARWQFLLGKYLGLMATVAGQPGADDGAVPALTSCSTRRARPRAAVRRCHDACRDGAPDRLCDAVRGAHRPMLGTVFTLAVFVIGHVVEDIWLLTRHVDSRPVRPLVAALYAVLPNLERFNFKTEAVHDLGSPPARWPHLIYGPPTPLWCWCWPAPASAPRTWCDDGAS